MSKMFGFGDFGSTKGASHEQSNEEAVFKQFIRKRDYKQYMNKRPGVRG